MKKITTKEFEDIVHKHEMWCDQLGGVKADLSYTDLSGLKYDNLDLKDANLEGANLSGSEFNWCDFSGANLKGADLSYAKLGWPVVRGTNFTGANTEGIEFLFPKGDGAKCLPVDSRVKRDPERKESYERKMSYEIFHTPPPTTVICDEESIVPNVLVYLSLLVLSVIISLVLGGLLWGGS